MFHRQQPRPNPNASIGRVWFNVSQAKRDFDLEYGNTKMPLPPSSGDPIRDFLLNIAANLATDLLKTGANRLRGASIVITQRGNTEVDQ